MRNSRLARWAVLIFIMAFAPTVFAHILFEPVVGGQFSGSYDVPANHDLADGNFTSLVYGGRLGLEYSQFSFGAEYLGDNSVNLKAEGPNLWGSSNTSASMTNTNYGAFIAYEFMHPLTVRLIGTFFISSQSHITHVNASGATDSDFDDEGYGYKGEVSMRLARYVALGVSYYYMVYTKTKDNMAGGTNPAVPVNTQQAVMVLLTFPLDLD